MAEEADNIRDRLNVSGCDDGTCDCGVSGVSGSFDRREFIKLAAGSFLGCTVCGGLEAAGVGGGTEMQIGCGQPDEVLIQHFVPVDKNLPQVWYSSLYERGEASSWYTGKELETIGMPIGGIAAGQLYLLGDGRLGLWRIFNEYVNTGYGRDNYKYRSLLASDMVVDQGFAVSAKVLGQRGEPEWRRLCKDDFGEVEFTGEYPIGKVGYKEAGYPLAVGMRAFSPFIPLNAEDSALPVTIFEITLKNITVDNKVRVGVAGWLENGVHHTNAELLQADKVSRVVAEENEGKWILIAHSSQEASEGDNTDLRPGVVLEDFEDDKYVGWSVTGDAFGDKPSKGTEPTQQKVTGFEGEGLVNTYRGSDINQGTLGSPAFRITRKFINFLIGGGDHPNDTCINLIVGNQVVRSATGKDSEVLEWQSWYVSDFEGEDGYIVIVDRHSGGWGHINIDQIEMADMPRQGPGGPLSGMEDYGTMVLGLLNDKKVSGSEQRKDRGWVGRYVDGGDGSGGDDEGYEYGGNITGYLSSKKKVLTDSVEYPVNWRGYGVVASEEITLEPGEECTLKFVLAWHFINLAEVGRYYGRRFSDAVAVARYVFEEYDRLAGDTFLWHDTYYEDSSLPRWLLERLHFPVANLATETCQWRADGRFWAWEGVGCCAGTCTHVWNYAQAAARLFPELERSVREQQDLGIAFQANGLVGFRGEENGAYAADGQAGTVLKCYREHLISGSRDFLSRNWGKIRKCIWYLLRQDVDEDGLIENSQHNTYDINFHGANTMVGSLYLAALRAGSEMALEMGDKDFAALLKKVFESGSRLSSQRLFNGEYYIQEVDLDFFPEHQYGAGCLSDQMFGQGWAHQLGLGYIYPAGEVISSLQAIWKYNWAPDIRLQNEAHTPERWFVTPGEAGLFTCTWPRSKYLERGVRYRNEVWTGIEYQVAGHMIWEGMVDEGLSIIRGVHERYHPLKHNPYNEVECGDHYARALASWGCLLAISGFSYDGSHNRIGFAPRFKPEDFRGIFTAAAGWGTFEQKRINGQQQSNRLKIKWGLLELKVFEVNVPVGTNKITGVNVRIGGIQSSEFKHTINNNRVVIEFLNMIELVANSDFEVIIDLV